jgi:hypothetical protein
MKQVIERLEQRSAQFAQLPLFSFLRDRAIDPHFVMSFADLYDFVLQVNPTSDPYQQLVNAHALEDANHWRWFLDDLEKLGFDERVLFSEALRFVWGAATANTRALTYRMCRLGYDASPLEKLVLVHVIESAGKTTVDAVSAVGVEYSKQSGKKLVYLGHHHLATESAHTIEDAEVHRGIEAIAVPPNQRPGLLSMVDQGFDAFAAFTSDMLATARTERTLSAT